MTQVREASHIQKKEFKRFNLAHGKVQGIARQKVLLLSG
ncbi:hypothetical protein NIES2104_37170 [Leptolyngbya sp. NIES-2104]|nr:hypothetical protein NIES2104_37170 [Leptolyngbya sp. NIES-2104]